MAGGLSVDTTMGFTALDGMTQLVDLSGKRGLVVGIANESSIATGCAEAFSRAGASLGAFYVNAKSKPFAQAVTERLKMDWTAPYDVRVPGELEALFLDGGLSTLSKRERRVIETIARHQHVTRSVNRAVDERLTFGDRSADRVAGFGGSWAFIPIFIGLLIGWVVFNTLAVAKYGMAFDSYPFIFLNLILSMVAALQAPIILMSQNRQAVRDRIAAALDYEVNLKAELESMVLHDMIAALSPIAAKGRP